MDQSGKRAGGRIIKMEKIYIVTDSCMWERSKLENTNKGTHFIEVVDEETGQTVFIKSGSRIKFVDGDLSKVKTQEEYNKL